MPQAPVAPAKSTTQSRFEARKAKAAQKQAAKLQKYEARLEKGRKRVEAKGLTPKTQRPTTETTVEPVLPAETGTDTSTFSQEIESIFNNFMQTTDDTSKPIDPESYDVTWDGKESSLSGIINELEQMEMQLSSAIQRARSAKKSTKLVDQDLIAMGLSNIEAFADDTMDEVPYSGVKSAYKNKLMALANNISSIKADLFG